MKNMFLQGVSFLFIVTLVISCKGGPPFLFGPPFTREAASEFLISTGTPAEIISKIVNMSEMSREEFLNYSRSNNINVRFLIASNPHTPNDLLIFLAEDNNTLVRQGVALNSSIKNEIIDLLKNDNNSVVGALVGNPSVSEDVILWIYKTNRKLYLSDFAINPRCPEIIKNDIMKSKDDFAKEWLEINKKRATTNNNDGQSPAKDKEDGAPDRDIGPATD